MIISVLPRTVPLTECCDSVPFSVDGLVARHGIVELCAEWNGNRRVALYYIFVVRGYVCVLSRLLCMLCCKLISSVAICVQRESTRLCRGAVTGHCCHTEYFSWTGRCFIDAVANVVVVAFTLGRGEAFATIRIAENVDRPTSVFVVILGPK